MYSTMLLLYSMHEGDHIALVYDAIMTNALQKHYSFINLSLSFLRIGCFWHVYLAVNVLHPVCGSVYLTQR